MRSGKHTTMLIASFFAALSFSTCGGGSQEGGGSENLEPNIPPRAVIRVEPTTGPAPLGIQADASASSDPENAIVSWDWDFGDGSFSEGEFVTHSYPSPGTYTVTLTVTDAGGESAEDSASIVVFDPASNQPPEASIRLDRVRGPAPLTIHADASTSSDPENAIASRDWDFGDGSFSEGEFVTHSYPSPGTYTVTLTVTDAGGKSAAESISVLVGPPGPVEPPPQLGWGPGGSEYPYGSVLENSYGSGAARYWIFEPGSPTPGKDLPVIGFIHGFTVVEPSIYRNWIRHIVRRGNILIFPQYQETIGTPPSAFTGNAIAAIKSALAELDTGGGHASPDRSKFALVGHSWGGVISANIAALAPFDPELPPISALQCTEPGTGGFGTYEDYGKIPAGTLLLSIAGEDDILVGETDARRIYLEATAIPEENKDYILVRSDEYGSPAILADHSAPTDIGIGAASIRWFGFWKWFDALSDAAFYGKNREYALGNRPEQRFMGHWSDGTAVMEPIVTDMP